MTDALPRLAREPDCADRYHRQLCEVAYLIGFYGARAGHTHNADLAALVSRLDEITRDPE